MLGRNNDTYKRYLGRTKTAVVVWNEIKIAVFCGEIKKNRCLNIMKKALYVGSKRLMWNKETVLSELNSKSVVAYGEIKSAAVREEIHTQLCLGIK